MKDEKLLIFLGFTEKSESQGGGFTKKQYRGEGELSKKGGLGQFTDLRGAQQERGGGVFEGELTP